MKHVRSKESSSLMKKDASPAMPRLKVCMHVLDNAQSDRRAMRAAMTLVEAGFEVSIVDITSKSTLTQGEEIGGVQVRHMRVPSSFITTRFKRWPLLRAARMFIQSTLRLIQTPADIYHALDLPAFPACYVAAQLRGRPLIFEAYELPLSTLPISALSRGRRWLHRLLTPFLIHVLPRCAGVITVSPPLVQEMRNRYHCKEVILLRNIPVYRAVAKSDRLRHHLGLSSSTRIILYQGNLQPDRSLDLLVQAAAFLEANSVIVMMGKGVGTTVSEIEALIAREQLADRVKLLPPVPYVELLDWTASADIGLIICSTDYSSNVRMFLPNKLFEYLMAGLPVLASELEAIADILNTYGVGRTISSLAPADIAAAINTMLADAVALSYMHHNALNVAQQVFCWEKEKGELIRLYHQILSGSPADTVHSWTRQGEDHA